MSYPQRVIAGRNFPDAEVDTARSGNEFQRSLVDAFLPVSSPAIMFPAGTICGDHDRSDKACADGNVWASN